MDVVVGKDLPDGVDARLDGGFVIGGGVLTEQILQDVRRHDRVALDRLDQVLAYDDAGEMLVDLAVERRRCRRRFRSPVLHGLLAQLTDFAHHYPP